MAEGPVRRVAAGAVERRPVAREVIDRGRGGGEQGKRQRAPRMKPDERREQVLEVAAQVFAQKGYRLANVSDIIEGAGIGRGTFYLYFSSKRDVFLDLIERYFEGFAAVLQENKGLLDESIKKGGPELLQTWRGNIVRILAYHRDNSDLSSVVYREALGRDEDFSERVEELSNFAREQLSKEFKLLQERGLIREADIGVVTTMVMGTIIYVIMEHLIAGSKGGKRSMEDLADEMLAYHLRALLPDAPVARAVLEDAAKASAAKRRRSSR
jgi:AcrR family transcriptional regulator